jgi:DNA-nicking Smr family endonuclease
VHRSGSGGGCGETKPKKAEAKDAVAGENDPAVEDRELFLSALGEMTTTFRDELPTPSAPLSAPRRMKQMRQGRLVPEAEVDLHGLTRAEALDKVGHFLARSAVQGLKTILLITGRGRGSGGEAILRDAVERLLTEETGKLISEWGRAPKQFGGEGALVVFLKNRGG